MVQASVGELTWAVLRSDKHGFAAWWTLREEAVKFYQGLDAGQDLVVAVRTRNRPVCMGEGLLSVDDDQESPWLVSIRHLRSNVNALLQAKPTLTQEPPGLA